MVFSQHLVCLTTLLGREFFSSLFSIIKFSKMPPPFVLPPPLQTKMLGMPFSRAPSAYSGFRSILVSVSSLDRIGSLSFGIESRVESTQSRGFCPGVFFVNFFWKRKYSELFQERVMETFIIIGVCVLCYQALDFVLQCANQKDSDVVAESQNNQLIYTVSEQVDSFAGE